QGARSGSVKYPHDGGIRVDLQTGHEVSPVAVDALEQTVAVIAQVEEQQTALPPRPYPEKLTVVSSFRAHLHGLRTLAENAHHHRQLGGRLRMIGPAGRKCPRQQVVQVHHGTVHRRSMNGANRPRKARTGSVDRSSTCTKMR